jgi:hypothetical protein
VPHAVRMQPFVLQRRCARRSRADILAKNEPYPKPSEGSSPVVAKDSLRPVWMNPEFLEQPSDQIDGFRPQRANAFLTALAM